MKPIVTCKIVKIMKSFRGVRDMAKSMKMEIALIVGIVFFCCWCAYIIIKMIMSQESAATAPQLHHQPFPYQQPSFQNHHELQQRQNQYVQLLANQAQNSNPLTNPRYQHQYQNPSMSANNQLKAVNYQQRVSPTTNLQFSPIFPANMHNQQHKTILINKQDLYRQRQAEATSPHWQAILPNQQETKNQRQMLDFLKQPTAIQQHASQLATPAARQQHQLTYSGNGATDWVPRAAVQHAWRTQHNANAANNVEDSVEQDNNSQTVATSTAEAPSDNDNEGQQTERDAGPDPDSETADQNTNQTDQTLNEDLQEQQEQHDVPQQDEQGEQRAARRSFSESEEEATERDSKGRPIVRHRSHMINGKPAQTEQQIQAARDAGTQKFDSIVNEIEQNEPTTPDYDENEAQDATITQRGDESRLINKLLSAPKDNNSINNSSTKVSKKKSKPQRPKETNTFMSSNDDALISNDSEPKLKEEKHNHKLKESLTAKQWDDSQGGKGNQEHDNHDGHGDGDDNNNQEQDQENPDVAREKMEQESRDDHVDFADLDLLSDPNDFPFMTSAPTTTSSISRRRRRRSADSLDLSDANKENAAGVGLRGALIDVINRIEQKNVTRGNGTISTQKYELPIETELRPPPSEESVDSLSDEDSSYATDEELGPERRQDLGEQQAQPNGHFYAPEMYNNSLANFYNLSSTEDQAQRTNNLTRFPVDATIGVTALSQPANYSHSQAQPETQYYSEVAPPLQPQTSLQAEQMLMPTPQPMINYMNNIEQQQQNQYQPVPEYYSQLQSTPIRPPAASYQSGPDEIMQNFYPNYEMHQSPTPMGSKAYSQTKKKKQKKRKKLLLEEDKKLFKKKKKKVGEKVSKGKSYKKKAATHRGAMKKRKHKAGKKMAKGYKEFKGATKGHKGKKGVGERGAKKGTLLYKDKGYKKRGFKKAYQKLESGDHKTYFDEFRDKDHKKKWKDFKDKHQFSQNKKWAAKDKKRFDHHKLDEMKDKKSKSGGWNKKSMSKHKKDYKFKGQHLEKSKAKKKKKKMSQKKKKKKSTLSEAEKYDGKHH